ncbi:MAG TPA: pilus assembly protein PilP [Burkholderiales bacterium]|jgi:type IV pilus assembly protein PilP|nr:pilus assembly protein PilP [Burkholderiales bacterium]
MTAKNNLRLPVRTVLAGAVATMALAGCGGGEHQEVQKWMADATKDMRGKVEKIEEPKKFAPFKYESEKQMDPFNADKVALLPTEGKKGTGTGIAGPDMTRRREVLESFPLENLKMVGMLQQKGATYGIIKADSNLHRVKIGNYMGQNFGIITNITESEITLKELVQDGGGDWVERVSTLQLQEEKQ